MAGMNKIIEELLATRKTITPDGKEIKLHSEISAREGRFLYDHIKGMKDVKKTLEIGCAYGLSALHICEALKAHPGARHVILDPYQSKSWEKAGVHALRRAGFENFELVEERSEIALPAMLATHEGTFDFIFIDGWHTFDHTMLDLFYATRLLKVGGVLAVDDYDTVSVDKAVKYFSNYPCYRFKAKMTDYPAHPALSIISKIASLIPIGHFWRYRLLPRTLRRLIRRPSIVSLEKIAADERASNWYERF